MIYPSELRRMLDEEPQPKPPRLEHYPWPAPPQFYECDCGARYSRHDAMIACSERRHGDQP